jgi:hypothetical protein
LSCGGGGGGGTMVRSGATVADNCGRFMTAASGEGFTETILSSLGESGFHNLYIYELEN